jgi:hypothetical protein
MNEERLKWIPGGEPMISDPKATILSVKEAIPSISSSFSVGRPIIK